MQENSTSYFEVVLCVNSKNGVVPGRRFDKRREAGSGGNMAEYLPFITFAD